MTSLSYELILPFPDGSESFVNGFEAGEIWALLRSGQIPDRRPVHTANLDLINRMAVMYGCVARFDLTPWPEWTDVSFERKSHLQEVKS